LPWELRRTFVWVLTALALCACEEREAPRPLEAPTTPLPKATSPSPYQELPVTTRSKEALTEFLKARSLVDNNRDAEARPGFEKAIKLDPNFALAHCYVGYYSHGSDGPAELQRAVELSMGLPEPERLFIQLYAAKRKGDEPAMASSLNRLYELIPNDPRISFEVGQRAFEHGEWERAAIAYSRSAAAKPNCDAFNSLGYALAMDERYAFAISALERCVELAPNEPNALDSLGEIYLAAGRLTDAEAAFQRSVKASGNFWASIHGLAVVRQARGDWPSVFKLLGQAKGAAAIRATDQLEVDELIAWAQFAEGNSKEALERLHAMEKTAQSLGGEGKYDLAQVALLQSSFLTEMGRYDEAVSAAALALQRAEQSGISGAMVQAIRLRSLLRRAWAQTKLGRLAEAKAALTELEALAKKSPNGDLGAYVHLIKGGMALAAKDLKAAQDELRRCQIPGVSTYTYDFRDKPEDTYCVWQLIELDKRLGENGEAQRLAHTLQRRVLRDPLYLYVRTKIAAD
jgi:tetratricopeptide (TPR) repeat protein